MLWLLVYGGISAVSVIALARLVQIAPLFDENQRPMASWARGSFAGARVPGRSGGRRPSRPRSFHLTREARSFHLAR